MRAEETIPGDEELHRLCTRFIPVGRLGSPGKVTEAVLALVHNPFLTAQTVSVDGGITHVSAVVEQSGSRELGKLAGEVP